MQAQCLFVINLRRVQGTFYISYGCCGIDVAGIWFEGGFVLYEVKVQMLGGWIKSFKLRNRGNGWQIEYSASVEAFFVWL